MEEMQEALRGKGRVHRLDLTDRMPSDAECGFSSDSLDDRATRDESSQRDSSTVMSEFSSTRTLMNIGDDARLPLDEDEAASKGNFSSRRYSDSTGTEENVAEIRYSWQIDTSQKEQGPTESDLDARLRQRKSVKRRVESKYVSHTMLLESKKNTLAKSMTRKMVKSGSVIEKSHATSVVESKRNIVASEMRRQERKQSMKVSSVPKQLLSIATESAKYTARGKISGKPLVSAESSSHKEEKSNKIYEDYSMSSNIFMGPSSKCKKRKIVLDFGEFPPPRHERRIQERESFHSSAKISPDNPKSTFHLSPIEESSDTSSASGRNKSDVTAVAGKSVIKSTYSYRRKYHTYPRSRIPVPKYSKERRFDNYPADPRMFPLEPREIDLESFQQLHTADSQEELQEFLLLESQCSGNLGLAGNVSEASYGEHYTDDERGSMSGRISLKTNGKRATFRNNHACTFLCVSA